MGWVGNINEEVCIDGIKIHLKKSINLPSLLYFSISPDVMKLLKFSSFMPF